jgi:hypothetical protein
VSDAGTRLRRVVPTVPVPHPLRISDDLGVVCGNREFAGQVVGCLRVLDPASGPFTVVRDEDDGGRRHRCGGFHERFHALSGARELLEVGRVGAVGCAVEAALCAPALPV